MLGVSQALSRVLFNSLLNTILYILEKTIFHYLLTGASHTTLLTLPYLRGG